MSDKAVPFFNPSDVTSLGGDWVVQDNGLVESFQRAQGLGATGDEAARKLYDGKTAGPVTLECFTESGFLTLPSLGSVGGGYHIDSWTLVYQQTGWPRLTLNLHQHDQNSHADTEMNEFTTTLKLPAQYGIPRSLTDAATGLVTMFENTDTDSGMKALTISLSCQHLDEPDGTGNHLAGENRDGEEKIEAEFTKEPATLTIHADFDEIEDGSPKGNTAAETGKMTWVNHLARD